MTQGAGPSNRGGGMPNHGGMPPGGGPPRGPGGPMGAGAGTATQGYAKPIPGVDEDTKPFWDFAKKHELRMHKCNNCGQFYYPPSSMCPHCQNWGSEWVKLSGKGEIYSFIVVRRATNPAFAKEIPYVVAIILTQEGTRMISNVVGINPENVKIGMPVEVVFEDATEEFTLPKFKPVA